MGEFSERWLSRLRRAVSGLNWVFVTVGIVGVFIGPAVGVQDATAVVLALAYTIAIQTVPLAWLRRPLSKEALVVTATAVIASAAALSGGFRSPFVLLTITPIVIAALVGGYRLGVGTGLLSVSLTALSEIASGNPDWLRIGVWAGFGVIVAVTFGLARKLILELVQQADVIAALSAETGAQLERLQSANNLLTKFEDLTVAAELDVESVGHAVLGSVRTLVPFDRGEVESPVGNAVAALGSERNSGTDSTIPIEHNGRTMGSLRLSTARPLTQRQRDLVAETLAPVGLAFANIEAVQRIAKSAIAEERARVARELHDGIGPGLATLGLALDVAQMQSADLPGLSLELGAIRNSVTGLVQDVRATVQDLRADDEQPLAVQLADLDWGDVAFVSTVDYRVEPRSRLIGDVNAIIVEAARNALKHAGATTVRIAGFIDWEHGHVTVSDDGAGFDPDGHYPGHFGLVGMRERAARIDGRLRIESGADGTHLTLEWPVNP